MAQRSVASDGFIGAQYFLGEAGSVRQVRDKVGGATYKMWWVLLYVANAPILLASFVDLVVRVLPTEGWTSWLAALASAGVSAATVRACRHETVEGRNQGVSMTKGVCILLVAVIHSADPEVLDGWMVHRRLINLAVPAMLVCYGITCGGSTVRSSSTLLWLRRRAQRIVPLSLVALAAVWTLRVPSTFCKAYLFVGGKLPVGLCVAGSALFLPGCVGGLWFVTAFAQILLLTNTLVRHVEAVAPALVAWQIMIKSSLETMHPSLPYVVPPCDGGGISYATSNALAHAGYVALGVAHGASLSQWFEARPPIVAGAACLAVATLTELLSGCKQALLACQCLSALVFATASIGTLRRAPSRAPFFAFLSYCGDESFAIYVGHVVALNLLVRDFTMASYRLPFDGVARVASFVALSVGAGLGVVRVQKGLSKLSSCRVSLCALLALGAAATALQSQQYALRPTPLPSPELPRAPAPVFAPPEQRQASPETTKRAAPIEPRGPYATFTLVKGGADELAFAKYEKRTSALSAFLPGVDDIAFHEGNVPVALQEALARKLRVRFFDARQWGAFDDDAVAERIGIRLPGEYPTGYKHMCRFFALQWMHALARHQWVMRLDEDVVVKHIDPNIFQTLDSSRAVYAYAAEVDERHEETVQTFQPWLDDYAAAHAWKTTVDVKRMFFTNVFAAKPSWWLGERVSRFLADIDDTGNIYLHRWGDAPIQTVAVKAFASSHEIAFVPVDYEHGSTHNVIHHGRERPMRTSARLTDTDRMAHDFENNVLPCLVADVHAPRHDDQKHDDIKHALDALRARLMLQTSLGKAVIDPLSSSELIEGVRTSSEDAVFTGYFLAEGERKRGAIAELLHVPDSDVRVSLLRHSCKTHSKRASAENFEHLKKIISLQREKRKGSFLARELTKIRT